MAKKPPVVYGIHHHELKALRKLVREYLSFTDIVMCPCGDRFCTVEGKLIKASNYRKRK